MATLQISISATGISASKSFSGTDTDIQAIVAWGTVAFAPQLQQAFGPGPYSSLQVLQAVMNNWIQGIKNAVQQFQTATPTPPPPITLS